MLALDGHCKTLDAAADCYVRAEACIAMLLTSGEDAGAAAAARESLDGAVILRSTYVNQDGRSSSLTAPNGPSQQQVCARGTVRCIVRSNHASAHLRTLHCAYTGDHGGFAVRWLSDRGPGRTGDARHRHSSRRPHRNRRRTCRAARIPRVSAPDCCKVARRSCGACGRCHRHAPGTTTSNSCLPYRQSCSTDDGSCMKRASGGSAVDAEVRPYSDGRRLQC